jgi:hypothetical protein
MRNETGSFLMSEMNLSYFMFNLKDELIYSHV